ncbi:hypothetical protein PILCRDRAFT_414845 [Piloderma croceum F 1598]|uniref:Uncharacterized protein n=1 Tax=Piloderma croceum (strain F 1598) TaxID=765440 RepID=A0A0C3C2M2_PILCF|nr:hypothetical protein PILCRDRAFT_414845 [Piloderma croceum F 1598]
MTHFPAARRLLFKLALGIPFRVIYSYPDDPQVLKLYHSPAHALTNYLANWCARPHPSLRRILIIPRSFVRTLPWCVLSTEVAAFHNDHFNTPLLTSVNGSALPSCRRFSLFSYQLSPSASPQPSRYRLY